MFLSPRKFFSLFLGCLSLLACTTNTTSNPARTATEEILISTAAEHAAANLALAVPKDTPVFIDATNFEGTDSKYALGAIRTSFLLQGIDLVGDKKNAKIIIEPRSGALSTDQTSFLVGIPSLTIPVPFASGPLTTPQVAFYGSEEQRGVAKFAVTGLDAQKGNLVAAQDPQYGFAHQTKKTILFVSWTSTDAIPSEDDQGNPVPPVAAGPPGERPKAAHIQHVSE